MSDKRSRRWIMCMVIAALVLVVGACGEAAPTAGSGDDSAPAGDTPAPEEEEGDDPGSDDTEAGEREAPEEDLVPVTFRLNWTLEGNGVPYVFGAERGFFADEGLDVEVQEGTGSAVTVQLVGNRTVEFGHADTPPVVFGIEEGIPIQIVANFVPTVGFALLWDANKHPDISTIEDVEGLRIGVHQGSTEGAVLPFALSSNGVDPDEDVTIVQGPPPTSMYTALVEDRVDVLMCLARCLLTLRDMDPEGDFQMLDLREYGADLLGHHVIVNRQLLEQQPDIVEAFARAAQRSWEYVLEDEAHMREAIEVASGVFPESETHEKLTWLLEDNLANLRTVQETFGPPLGYVHPELMAESAETMSHIVAEGDEREALTHSAEDYYTNVLD